MEKLERLYVSELVIAAISLIVFFAYFALTKNPNYSDTLNYLMVALFCLIAVAFLFFEQMDCFVATVAFFATFINKEIYRTVIFKGNPLITDINVFLVLTASLLLVGIYKFSTDYAKKNSLSGSRVFISLIAVSIAVFIPIFLVVRMGL